jgi:hypothetical protein
MSNNLESMLKNPSRRDFMKVIGAAGLGALTARCGGGNGGGPGPVGPTPTAVTQRILVLNSDGTELGRTSYDGNTNQNMTIDYNSLASKGVRVDISDPNYFAIREANQGDKVGNYVANTTNGQLSFTPTDSERVIWLMNNQNGADYAGAWNSGIGRNGMLSDKRYLTARRLTSENNTVSDFEVVDTDITPLIQATQIINDVWRVETPNGIVKMAEISWLGDAPSADINAGLGYWKTNRTASGVRIGNNYLTNAGMPKVTQKIIGSVEKIEGSMKFDDAFGRGSTDTFYGPVVFTEQTQMLPRGKDYARMTILSRP